jgi:hypothetical protein
VAGPTPTSTAVDAGRLNLPEALFAFGTFAARRTQRLGTLASDLAAGRKRPGELALEALDGNETDLEELTTLWKFHGVRWPILILMAIAFLGGVQAGRRR